MPLGYFPASDNGTIKFYEVELDASGQMKLDENGQPIIREAANPALAAAVLLRLHSEGKLSTVQVTPDGSSAQFEFQDKPSSASFVGEMIIAPIFEQITDRRDLTPQQQFALLHAVYGDDPQIAGLVITYVSDSAAHSIWQGAFVIGTESMQLPDAPVPTPAGGMQNVEASQGQGPLPPAGGTGGQVPGGTALTGSPTGQAGGDSDGQGTSSDPEKTGGDPIVLFSGQLYHQVTDLEVAGLGLHFGFRRTYLNQTIYKGPLGYNWDHTYNLWLRETQEFLPDGRLENVVYRSTGSLREDRYVQDITAPIGDLPSLESFPDAVFKGPPAFFDRLEKSGNRYVLEMPTGVRFEYGENLFVERIVDLNGNAMTFKYDGFLLIEVTDPVGKRFVFEYDSLNRITSLYDTTGDRRIRYYYGDNGDLEEVDLDFADLVAGTDYRYSGPDLPFELQHNLVEMISPLGESVLECDYGTTPGALGYNRVMWQRSVEGEFKYEYDFVYDSDVDPATDRVNVPFTATSVTYPNGHVIEHQFNRQGNVVKRLENVLSAAGTIETLVARYRYNEDGLLIEEVRAEGGAVEYRYEREVFAELHQGDVDSATPRERLAFGNLLKIIERPRAGFGETRSIVTDYTYTQVGNRIASQQGPYYANLQLQELPGQAVGEVHHEFDARGNLIRVRYADTTNADGQPTPLPSTSYDLDELGRMVAIVTGPLKTKISYFADRLRSGFVRERIADSNGAALRVEFDVDPLGRTTRTVDHLGSVSESEYTSFDTPKRALLPQMTEGGPRPVLSLTYNKNRQLVRSEESVFLDDGREHPDKVLVSSYRYDRYGRLVEASAGSPQSPGLRSQKTVYEPSGLPRKQIDSLENQTLIEYDARMLVRKVTRGWDTPSVSTRRMRYNRAGELIETTDSRGFKTAIARDAFGRVRRLTTPDGTKVEAEYDAAGRAIRRVLFGVHPETGATVRWSESGTTYDSAGRMIESRIHRFIPGGSESDEVLRTRYYYDSMGRAERIVDPIGSEWRYEYDNLGRLIRQFDPDGNELQTKNDDAARTVTIIAIERGTDSTGAPVSRSFQRVVQHDRRGLPVAEIDNLGNTLRRAYDSRGLVLKVTSASGQTYISECDILGQVSRQLTVLGDRTLTRHFEHDANGNVTRIISPAGGSVDYEIDSLSRIVRTSRNNGAETRFSYDTEGNLVEYRSEDGVLIRRAFSAEGKLLSEEIDVSQFAAPQELPTYTPSPALPAEFRYTPSGSLARARNDASTCIYRYDSIGRMLEEQSGSRRISFGYDSAGRRTSMAYPDGRKLKFGYGQSGSLARIDQTARGSAYPGDVSSPETRTIVKIDREGRRPTAIRFGSTHELRLQYDQRQQAIEMDWVKSGGGRIARLRYLHGSRGDLRVCQLEDRVRIFSYDALARLTGVKDYRQPNAIPLPGTTADQQQMDALIASVENQLASASPERTFGYVLDANTNRLRSDERLAQGGALQTTEYIPDGHDRYLSVGDHAIVHDRAGNMLDDGVNSYRHDALGRLAETLTPQGRVNLTRDALGRVVRVSSPDGESEFLYAGKRLVEWRKAGVVEGQIVPFERPNQIAHLATQGRDLLPLFDHMDSVLGWVTPAGAIDSSAFYDPFGQILEQTPNWPAAFGFAGFLYDKFSRNYETLARTYSPRLGRFVQPDPMGYVDGMNLYAFAHHAPGSLTDYFGFSSNDIDWGIVGWEAGSTVLTGAAALLAGTALVVGGIVSLPAMLAAGGIAAVFGLTVSILHRGKEAIDAGVSDDDLFWKASVAGIGDQVGATDIYQGVTGTEVFSGKTLGTKRRSELLGGGIGSLGTEAMGSVVAKPFAKFVDAKLPATKFSGKYWDNLSKPELAPELGPVAVGSSEIVVSQNALAMHIAASKPVHITLGYNSLENLDDVTLMAHGLRQAGTDELSGAFQVRLDGYGDVSPERMAEILYLDAGWKGGTLRLAACNTGNFNPQLNGIFGDLLARELARLGVPTVVIAPTGPVSAMVPGSGFGLPRIRTTPSTSPLYLQPGRGWEYFAY